MPSHRFLSVLVAGSLLFAPLARAATAPQAVRVRSTAAVTRGDFLRSAMKSLKVTLMEDRKKLPYRRIPKALEPYVQTAYELGVVKGWGYDASFQQPVTRGEAAELVVLLNNASKVSKRRFADVDAKTARGRAILTAVEEGWMKPENSRLFGAAAPLTRSESASLLLAAGGDAVEKAESGKNVPVLRIKINSVKKPLPNQEVLEKIWHLLTTDYLYKDKLKYDEAGFKAVEGLIQSAADPYTTFMRPSSARNFQQQMEGEVTGIGAQVEQKEGTIIIVTPLSGSPAEKAGLQPGDFILSVDGKTLSGLSFEDAVNRIRGPKDTQVQLHINRNGSEFDVTVTRDIIKIPEVEISWRGEIAVVKLIQFGETTDKHLRGDMEDVQKRSPKGLILDLRNNPGGLLHAAGVVLSNFLPEGSVFATIETPDGSRKEITEEAPTIGQDVKIVVLVNKGSASASEIVAGALQDTKRATILGEKTYGKGSVQQVYPMPDGSKFKMTVATWKTPKGRIIDGNGVEPDILVEKGDRDEQMIRALDILR